MNEFNLNTYEVDSDEQYIQQLNNEQEKEFDSLSFEKLNNKVSNWYQKKLKYKKRNRRVTSK